MYESPRNLVLLLLILATAYAIRITPYLVSGVPYHTDTWAMLPVINVLLEKTPVPLSPDVGFDNYNVYWPGLALFAAVLSNVVGLRPIHLLPLASPFVSSLSTLMLYAFLRRIGSRPSEALVASLFFGLAGGEAILTAGVTKEGYALPLFVLMLFLLSKGIREDNIRFTLLNLAVIPTLALSHHLTSVVALSLISYFILSHALYPESRVGALRWSFLISLAFAFLLYVYFFVYAYEALPFRLSETDLTSIIGYQVLSFTSFLLSPVLLSRPSLWVKRWIIAALILVLGLVIAALNIHVMVGAPTLSPIDLILTSPYMATSVLAVLGSEIAEKTWGRSGIAFIGMWIIGLLAVELYIVFGTPGLPSDAYRLANFLYGGVVILASNGWLRIKRRRFVSTLILALIVGGMLFTLPYTSFLSGPLGGSQRVYSTHDLAQADWIARYCHGAKVHGDLRLSYLLYMKVDVEVRDALSFLLGEGCPPKGCLVITKLMEQVGFVATAYGIPIDSHVLAFLPNDQRLSLVYSSWRNQIFRA